MIASHVESRFVGVCLFSLLILAAACSEDDGTVDPNPNAADTLFERSNRTPGISDREVWDAAYGGKRTPDNFYHETLDASLYYLNTISIKPLGERKNAWYELDTEDSAQARSWSDLSEQYGSGGRSTILATRETEKFFEIHRSNGQNAVLYRAHRSNYFNGSGVDLLHRTSYQGRLTLRPITGDAVEELVEYFWFIRHDKVGGVSVLRSETAEGTQSFVTTLVEVHVMYGDWDVRDEIRLLRHQYTVDRVTGEISLESTVLEEFPGR